MHRMFVMALVAVALVPSVPAIAHSDAGRMVLEQLRSERQAAVIESSRIPATKPPIDLKPLLGVGRHDLLESLGAPDFCALPEDAGCAKSKRVAYFFYPRKPSTAKDMGNGFVEIVMTAGGGWALEINFTEDSVSRASWVKQE